MGFLHEGILLIGWRLNCAGVGYLVAGSTSVKTINSGLTSFTSPFGPLRILVKVRLLLFCREVGVRMDIEINWLLGWVNLGFTGWTRMGVTFLRWVWPIQLLTDGFEFLPYFFQLFTLDI